MFDARGMITLVDTDSFSVKGQDGHLYRCTAGWPECEPPEIQGKDMGDPRNLFTEETDRFALAVVIFRLLCNKQHPFGVLCKDPSGCSSRNGGREQNIVTGYCAYVTGSAVTPSDHVPDMAMFPSEIRTLFDRAFKYTAMTAVRAETIANRPTAREWREALYKLIKSPMKECANGHEYPKGYSKTCPWCVIPSNNVFPQPTPRSIGTSTGTPTGTSTGTPIGTPTGTSTGTPTGAPTGTSTGTPIGTPTGTSTGTPIGTSTGYIPTSSQRSATLMYGASIALGISGSTWAYKWLIRLADQVFDIEITKVVAVIILAVCGLTSGLFIATKVKERYISATDPSKYLWLALIAPVIGTALGIAGVLGVFGLFTLLGMVAGFIIALVAVVTLLAIINS